MLLQKIKPGERPVFIYVLRSFRNASASCSGCEVEVLPLPAVRRGWQTQSCKKLEQCPDPVCCGRFALGCAGWNTKGCKQREPAPLSHRLTFLKVHLNDVVGLLLEIKLVTWLCKQRYWYCKLTPTLMCTECSESPGSAKVPLCPCL